MEIRVVTWKNNNMIHEKWTGSKDFLVKESFDDSDAILKVRREVLKVYPKFIEGSVFTTKLVIFNEQGIGVV